MKAAYSDRLVLRGRYRLVRPLGFGVTGPLWAALPASGDKPVAVRLVSGVVASSPRFPEAWRAARDLSGARDGPSSAARILDLAEDGPRRCVVRELIEVEPLSSRLARQPRLPVDEAVHITLRMAEALAWIHRAGVAHGGIRPSNVFVRNRTVVVSDFGINQGLVADRPDLDASLELTGCAPEQLTGLRVGPASDVYAVGVLLYRMLAGVAPFVGQDPEETAKAQIGGRAVPLTSLDIEVPKEVAETCQLCLAKDPSTRPTWASLVIALASRESVPAAATDHIDSTSRPEPTRIEVHENPPRIMPGPRRLSLAARAAVAVAAALLLSGIVIAGVDRGRPTPGSSSRPVRPVARAPTSGIRVPDLIGLPASDARASLLHKGLRVARLVPVAGTPGLVARTWPAPDRAVVPGTPVILFIGVEGERLRQEFDRSPSPS